jgi:predicted amidophosphoribosyltransferase
MAWGLLTERLCKACRSFSDTHPTGICSTCRRDLPLNGMSAIL